MPRHVLIRSDDGESVVRETELPAEKNLHDVLTSYSELIPADDMGLERMVVVGRESGLDSGYADLVLVDRSAQVCLVEVKKEGNPDTRRVVAQLLDYAAALWQMSATDFEQTILHPYLRQMGVSEVELPDIGVHAASSFGNDSQAVPDEAEETFDDFGYRLEQTLANGEFRLVVAAPSIPPGVQQVIEYLNSRGLLIYGLEVSFFSGPAECFVPRVVVKPRVSETKKLGSGPGPTPVAEGDFVQDLPERVRESAVAFLRACEAAGAPMRWHSYGAGVRTARGPDRLLAFLEKKRVGIVIKAPTGFPQSPFAEALQAAEALGVGSVSNGRGEFSARYEDMNDDQLDALLKIALRLVQAFAVNVDFHRLDSAITATFQRNDHNIWARSVPALADHLGTWLRGTLSGAGTEAAVRLEPLAGGQQGWKPQFDTQATLQAVWPTGQLEGDYVLTVTDAGTLPD